MKTNKSFAKRLRVTRRGYVLARQPGQNHFRAKTSRVRQLAGKRLAVFRVKRKVLSRFLPIN